MLLCHTLRYSTAIRNAGGTSVRLWSQWISSRGRCRVNWNRCEKLADNRVWNRSRSFLRYRCRCEGRRGGNTARKMTPLTNRITMRVISAVDNGLKSICGNVGPLGPIYWAVLSLPVLTRDLRPFRFADRSLCWLTDRLPSLRNR